jgi:Leucine-rich repeat (LRR) protein
LGLVGNYLHEIPLIINDFKKLEDLRINCNPINVCNIDLNNTKWKRLDIDYYLQNLIDLSLKSKTLKISDPTLDGQKYLISDFSLDNLNVKERFGLKDIFDKLGKISLFDANLKSYSEIEVGIGVRDKKVISIRLPRKHLRYLPASILELSNLNELVLDDNFIEELPNNLNNLSNLEILSLNNNSLSDFPTNIENLKYLKSLFLNNNHIRELPDSIKELISLQEIQLEDNYLTLMPESFTNLINLKSININGNSLNSLPESLGNCKALSILEANSNHLHLLPESIGNCTFLTKLLVSANNITNFPFWLSKLKKLNIFEFIGSRFQNESPEIMDILFNHKIAGEEIGGFKGPKEIELLQKRIQKAMQLKS